MTFGEKIKKFREAAGLSQGQLSERSGIPVGTIRNWEQGVRTQPYWGQVQIVAKALGVPCTELTDDDQPDDPIPQEDTRPKGKRK